MITEYIKAATEMAEFERMEDGRYFATIDLCPGFWAEGSSVAECVAAMPELLESWLIIKMRFGDELAVIGGIDLNLKQEYAEAD